MKKFNTIRVPDLLRISEIIGPVVDRKYYSKKVNLNILTKKCVSKSLLSNNRHSQKYTKILKFIIHKRSFQPLISG
jgi:hypothetical protein